MAVSTKSYKWLTVLLILIIVASASILSTTGKEQEKELTIGERFHYETSLTWKGVIGDIFQRKVEKPAKYKIYPESDKISLPKPDYRGIILEEAIEKCRSLRDYSAKAIDMKQLSQLLYAANGITGKAYGQHLRSAPSAGALYPFEIYIIVNNVRDLPKGIYHYSVLDHSLEILKQGDFSSQITKAGLDQAMLGNSAVTFVMSAIFDRVRHKYGERGFRYTYIEAGHISQNIYLQSASLNLGSVCVGAFLDKKINELIGVDGQNEAAIYIHAVGSL